MKIGYKITRDLDFLLETMLTNAIRGISIDE